MSDQLDAEQKLPVSKQEGDVTNLGEGVDAAQGAVTDAAPRAPDSKASGASVSTIDQVADVIARGKALAEPKAEDAADAKPDARTTAKSDAKSSSPSDSRVGLATRPIERKQTPLPSTLPWNLAGGAFVLLGSAVAIGPRVSPEIARMLEPLGDLRVHSVTLIVAGMFLIGVGWIRRALGCVRRSVESIGNDTARLDNIAFEGRRLSVAFDHIHETQRELTDDIGTLEQQIKKLTDLATAADHTVSVFRLAASVDQLGARLDRVIKDELSGVETRIHEATERDLIRQRTIETRFDELDAASHDQHNAQRLALQETFEQLFNETQRALASIEQGNQVATQLEARLQTCQDALAAIIEAIPVNATSSTDAIRNELAEVRAHFTQQLEQEFLRVSGRIDAVAGAVERADRERVVDAKEHAEELAKHVDERVEALTQRVETLGQTLDIAQQGIATSVEQLGTRLDSSVAEQQRALEQASKAQTASRRELEGKLETMRSHLGEALERQRKALSDARTHTEETMAALGVEVGVGIAQIQSRVDAQQRAVDQTSSGVIELASSIDSLREQVGQQAQEGERALTDSQSRTNESIAAVGRELNAGMNRLQARADEQKRSIEQASSGVIELAGSIESIQKRFEQHAQQNERALADAQSRTNESIAAVGREMGAGVSRLQANADEQQRSIEQALDAVGELRSQIDAVAKRGADEWTQALSRVEASTTDARRELGQRVDDVAQRVEAHSKQHSRSLRVALEGVAEQGRAAHGELRLMLEQLAERITQLELEQQHAGETGVELRREIGEQLLQLRERVEDQAKSHRGALQQVLASAAGSAAGAAAQANTDLAERMELLTSGLDELRELVETTPTPTSGGVTRRELDESLETLAEMFEQTLESRLQVLQQVGLALVDLADAVDSTGHLDETVEGGLEGPADDASNADDEPPHPRVTMSVDEPPAALPHVVNEGSARAELQSDASDPVASSEVAPDELT